MNTADLGFEHLKGASEVENWFGHLPDLTRVHFREFTINDQSTALLRVVPVDAARVLLEPYGIVTLICKRVHCLSLSRSAEYKGPSSIHISFDANETTISIEGFLQGTLVAGHVSVEVKALNSPKLK